MSALSDRLRQCADHADNDGRHKLANDFRAAANGLDVGEKAQQELSQLRGWLVTAKPI